MKRLRTPPGWLMTAGRYVVEACCLWEVVALHSKRRIPTISQIVHRYRSKPATKAVLSVAFSWLLHHLIIEEGAIIKELIVEDLVESYESATV